MNMPNISASFDVRRTKLGGNNELNVQWALSKAIKPTLATKVYSMLVVSLLSAIAVLPSVSAWGIPPFIPDDTPQYYCGCWLFPSMQLRRAPDTPSNATRIKFTGPANQLNQFCLNTNPKGYTVTGDFKYNCRCSDRRIRNKGVNPISKRYRIACDCTNYQMKRDGFMDYSTSASFYKPACGNYDWTQFGLGAVYVDPNASNTTAASVPSSITNSTTAIIVLNDTNATGPFVDANAGNYSTTAPFVDPNAPKTISASVLVDLNAIDITSAPVLTADD